MKKTIICIIVITFLISMLPSGSADAASYPKCSISTWQVPYNGQMVSGGCTCHVAERVKAVTGKLVPNWHNAGSWWSNSTWPKNTDTPKVGAIAAFGSGHVAYVESLTKASESTAVKVKTATYTLNWIKYTATLYKTTYTYKVKLSQKDFSRIKKGDNSVRTSYLESKLEKYKWVTVIQGIDSVSYRPLPTTPADTWKTTRTNKLQGFIYP
jgi:surface antigen